METEHNPVKPGEILSGSLFNEPMRVITINPVGADSWELGLVGLNTQLFRSVPLTQEQIATLHRQDAAHSYGGDCDLVRLGLQAYALGIAYEFDPYFGLSISRVDPLPHQLEAYDYLLKTARVRFLLADDAGAATIMAALLLRELKLRGLARYRVLIVCPANLTFQWQRELKEKFDEKFTVLSGSAIREQFGINQSLGGQVITSLDLAKRTTILPGLQQVHWDMVIVDEAHRMSWSPPARKTARYALGEMLRDSSDHILLLTATPHKGDPENFSRFLQLLDPDAYADVKSIREAMAHRSAPFYLRRTKEAMMYFPERQPDGTWKARKLFTKRDTRTADFEMDGEEFDLYRTVPRTADKHNLEWVTPGHPLFEALRRSALDKAAFIGGRHLPVLAGRRGADADRFLPRFDRRWPRRHDSRAAVRGRDPGERADRPARPRSSGQPEFSYCSEDPAPHRALTRTARIALTSTRWCRF